MRGRNSKLFYKDGTPVPVEPLDTPTVFPLYEDIEWPNGRFRETIKHPSAFDADELRAYEAGYYPIAVEYLDEAYHPLLRFAVERSLAKWTP